MISLVKNTHPNKRTPTPCWGHRPRCKGVGCELGVRNYECEYVWVHVCHHLVQFTILDFFIDQATGIINRNSISLEKLSLLANYSFKRILAHQPGPASHSDHKWHMQFLFQLKLRRSHRDNGRKHPSKPVPHLFAFP